MSGVAPVPVFAPAVPKASSPLEGILEVCRELIVRFYFGMPLRASLPAWRALLELSGALGCWGHGRARASSVWDCPMALLSPSVTSVLWPAAIWAMKRSLGWAVWLWSGFLHPALALRALCPICLLPHTAPALSRPPPDPWRGSVCGKDAGGSQDRHGKHRGVWSGFGCGSLGLGGVWEVLPCISGKGLQGGLQPAPSLES